MDSPRPPMSKKRSDFGWYVRRKGGRLEGCEWPSGPSPFVASPFYLLHLLNFNRYHGLTQSHWEPVSL